MYSFDDGGGDSFTLRPEGTAPVARAYLEHGMHKLPQPVKLWYLGAFFRRERPQKGRYRQFAQLGAEAIGSDDPAVDAELILLLAEILEAIGTTGLRLRLSSLGTPDTRAAYRDELQAYLRRHEDRLSHDVRERIDLNPLRAFDADHPGTQRGDARRAAAARPPATPRTPSTSTRSRSCSTPPGSPTRSTRRWCAASTTTRARCSSSRPTRSARSRASAAAGATTG